MENIVVITSVLNCGNQPLCYYPSRTVFSVETRYEQTLRTIESVRRNIPNCEIFLEECSDLSEYTEFQEDLKNRVEYYSNFYENEEVKEAVTSELKGWGEAMILLATINQLRGKPYKNLFKISGRYYLNPDFDYNIFENDENNFVKWDNSDCSFCTIFYKLKYDLDNFEKNLLALLPDVKNAISVELCFFNIYKSDCLILNKMNVSGCLSTEGYSLNV